MAWKTKRMPWWVIALLCLGCFATGLGLSYVLLCRFFAEVLKDG